MTSRPFSLALACIFLIALSASAVTTPRDLRSALDELAEITRKEAPENPISREYSDRTVRVRHRLRDYAIGSVVDATRRTSVIQEVLPLAGQRIKEAEPSLRQADRATGSDPAPSARLELFAAKDAPDWIGVRTEVSLPCGFDVAIYLLRLSAGPDGTLESTLAFAKENVLESVADLASHFEVTAHRAPTGQALRVATIEAAGGCSSLWKPVRMRVYQSDEHAYRPLRLFERERLAFLGESHAPRVSHSPEGLAFEYRTLFWLDADRHSRPEIVRLADEEQGVRLLPPQPQDPLAFVDEWVSTPWPDAQRWTSSGRLANVRKWHEDLARAGDSRLRTAVVESGECSGRQEVWVHLKAGEEWNRMRSVYGLLRVGPNGYRVEQFATELPAGCQGNPQPANQRQ